MNERMKAYQGWLFPAAVLLVALVAAWPAVAEPGLLNTRGGGDSPFLLQRLHQLVAALGDGHFPVRWMPDANYGYGYPFYNFYAPLSIYITAVFNGLGFSFVRSIHLSQLLGFAVAGLGMYALGRRWLGSRWAGLLAAVAYTVAPFHMVNVYTRGDSLAEFWAMAFYPLVLLAADWVLGSAGQARRVVAGRAAVFGLAYAALVLSHNISALIFSPFLLLYVALRGWAMWRKRSARSDTVVPEKTAQRAVATGGVWWALGGGLLLALGLAAWFFVPALAEQDLAQLGPVTEGYFSYTNHFRGLDLVQPALLFDYSPDGGRAFSMGLAQAGLALLGAAVLLVYWRQGRLPEGVTGDRLAFILMTALVATLMITPLSRLLWDYLPLLSFTQFPWRFLSVQALVTALLTGGIAWVARRELLVPAAALILLVAALGAQRTDHLILTDADVTAERLAEYEWFTGNIGSTVSAEYLPPGVNPRPFSSDWLVSGERNRAAATAGTLLSAELISREATTHQWTVTAGDAGATLRLPALYWPGWEATVDGQPALLSAHGGSGLMRLDVGPGEHTVELRLGRTPVRAAAEWVSLLALLVVGGLLLWGWRPADWRPWLAGGGLVIGVLLALGLLWRGEGSATLSDGDLTWDFAQMGYLHHDLDGVAFDNGAQLFTYGYSAAEIRAGETLTVTLSVDPGPGGVAALTVGNPALARPVPDGAADPPPVLTATQPLDSETLVFPLTISRDAPAGLVVPRLALGDGRPLMPSGQTRGDLFLRPVRILPAEDAPAGSSPLMPNDGLFAGDVRANALIMRDAQTLDGQFSWLTMRPLGQALQYSWRLQDGDGGVLAQTDAQPGSGFLPSVAWPAGQPVDDWLALRLPPQGNGVPPYRLVMLLYDPASGRQLLARRVGEMAFADGAWTVEQASPTFELPSDIEPLAVAFSDGERPIVELSGFNRTQKGRSVGRVTCLAGAGRPAGRLRALCPSAGCRDRRDRGPDRQFPRRQQLPAGPMAAGRGGG